MRAVERHGGKRIALGHGEQLGIHVGEPPNANRLVVHEFPSLEAVEAWVEDVKANREQLHTLGEGLVKIRAGYLDHPARLEVPDPGTPLRP